MKFHISIPFACAFLILLGKNSKADDPIFEGDLRPPVNPEYAHAIAWELQDALDLTTTQTRKVAIILVQERGDIWALSPRPPRAAIASIRQRALDQIRALLTPEQLAQFNLIPQYEYLGGGPAVISAKRYVDKLDAIVSLTPEEKTEARRIFQQAIDALMKVPEAERPVLKEKFGQVTRTKISSILTPAQRELWRAKSTRTKVISKDSGTGDSPFFVGGSGANPGIDLKQGQPSAQDREYEEMRYGEVPPVPGSAPPAAPR